MAERLGELTAGDIGAEVEFSDGGATYRATLVTVQHERNWRDEPRTMVTLRSGEWRHTKTYPAETPCTVTPTPSRGDETTPGVGRGGEEGSDA